MSKGVAAVGKVLKWGCAAGLVGWLGYESLYNSIFSFCICFLNLKYKQSRCAIILERG